MLVTTHALVASTVAIKTGNPYLYVPFAAVDHFLLDTFPHFDCEWVHKNYYKMAAIDAICGISLFLIIAWFTHSKFSVFILFAICFLAGWPDLVTLFQKATGVKSKKIKKFRKFHKDIQQLEFPAGILIEIAVVLGCLLLIFI